MGGTGTRIHLCGALRLEVAGEPRGERLQRRQGRLLLAYLILHRDRPARRDELIEALWSHDGVPPSEGALSPVLSRLRRAIEPSAIDGREALSLRLSDPVWVDVEQARAAVERARAAGSGAEVLEHARAADALLRPGLLPGLEAPWLDEQRDRICDLRVEALELGARGALGSDPATAERAAREAVALAPFRESSWAGLIEALAAQGNPAQALRVYDEIRTRLLDELGVTPGPELLALHSRLLTPEQSPTRARARVESPPVLSAPVRQPPPDDLVEREDELELLDRALTETGAGAGGVILFEGPAGIGKTRLLSELSARAADREMLVLQARASLLERDYAFGIVRQLFDAVADPTLLQGPAATARIVFEDAEAGAAEGIFRILNGLFGLVTTIARSQPVVLAMDDLQWSDPASLRFVAYLARRVASLPVRIGATIRTGEPESDDALLGELAGEPITVSVTPRPLSGPATARLVRERLGQTAEPAFTGACHEVTAGNPLLVRQLINALATEGVTPAAAHAGTVREIGPRAVARAVLLRLSRLPAPAIAVARAVAVLGEHPGLPAIAELAETDEAMAARAVRSLVRAEILRSDEPLGFVHPLVRDAIYHELPPAARALEHERAARLLARLAASPEQIAAQLLLAPPRGDPWVVERLREAAGVAMRRGAPDAAMRLLERAQAEPPPPEIRAPLALELGGSAAYLRGPAGVEPLRRAHAELTEPGERGRAAVRLSHLLLFVRSPVEGVELAQRADAELAGLPDDVLVGEREDLRDALRAIRLVAAAFGAVDPLELHRLDDVRSGPRGTGPGSRALTAMAALGTALSCGPAAEVTMLGREAFSAGLDALQLSAPIALGSAAIALGEPADGLSAIGEYVQYAQRNGEILSAIGADLWGGIIQIWAGDLPAAMRLLERAQERERLWGTKLDAVMAYSAAFLALAQLERGDRLDEVSETLQRIEPTDPRPDGARFWLASLAELRLAERHPEEAIEVTRQLEGARPPATHPVWAPWRSLRARALAQLGCNDEALELAGQELELARRIGSDWVIGRALRLLAQLSGADGVAPARDAIGLLAASSARLELARARAVYGDALAAAGDDAGAGEARLAAAALAEQCGAGRLEAEVRRRMTGPVEA